MGTTKMNAKEFLALWTDGDGEPEGWEEVSSEGWRSELKYQLKETVYSNGEQFFEVQQSRSGSYYSDYEYDEPDCYEVRPKEVTQVIYEAI